jgi:RsiW-degrading membrane proteinase PrsW (M82 family)
MARGCMVLCRAAAAEISAMDNKKKKSLRMLVMTGLFGMVVAFAVTILIFWIYQEIAPLIPMSLLIGALVGVAVKLFSDAIERENKK